MSLLDFSLYSSTTWLQLCILILVVSAIIKVFFSPKAKTRGDTIYLIGEVNSGKTKLLYHLSGIQEIQTTSSYERNETEIERTNADKVVKEVKLVDIPGHQPSRKILFDNLDHALGIVVMIDSSNPASFEDLADYIYNVFVKKESDKDISMLIVCNKQDITGALRAIEIEKRLINFIQDIKFSRKAQMDSYEDDYLKVSPFCQQLIFQDDEEKFSFDEYNVKFCELSLLNDNIKEVETFIDNLLF